MSDVILGGGFLTKPLTPTVSTPMIVTTAFLSRPVNFVGRAVISGTVKVLNNPARKQVKLFDKISNQFIKATWSADNGAYSFTDIDPAREYFVVAHDETGMYNAVVKDGLKP